MSSKSRFFRAKVLFPLAVVLLAGCVQFMDRPYFTVEESGLNWISIRYYNYNRKPVQKLNMRLDGNGVGYLRQGTSSLVSNAFAADTKESSWRDMNETRIVMEREDVIPLFQMLVDNGLFLERHSKGESANTNESIFVTANIQNRTCGSGNDDVFESDPELAENLKSIIMMFYHPRPKNRR